MNEYFFTDDEGDGIDPGLKLFAQDWEAEKWCQKLANEYDCQVTCSRIVIACSPEE
jgi:hypothetical protein